MPQTATQEQAFRAAQAQQGKAMSSETPNYIGGLDSTYQRDFFHREISAIFENCKEIALKKNEDYTKLNAEDPYYNFNQEEVQHFLKRSNVSHVDALTLGLLIRLNDKRRRITNILLTGDISVTQESIDDTISDIINYYAILLTHLRKIAPKKPYVPNPQAQIDYLQETNNGFAGERMRHLEQLTDMHQNEKTLFATIEALKLEVKELKNERNSRKKNSTRRK